MEFFDSKHVKFYKCPGSPEKTFLLFMPSCELRPQNILLHISEKTVYSVIGYSITSNKEAGTQFKVCVLPAKISSRCL